MPLKCCLFLRAEVGKQHVLLSDTIVKALDIKEKNKNKDLTLTVKNVSLFQFLSSGSLAKSPEGGKKKQNNYFYTVLSLLSTTTKVGQISEKRYSKFSHTCTSTVLRGATV